MVNNAVLNVGVNSTAGNVSGTGTTKINAGAMFAASNLTQGGLAFELAGKNGEANSKLNVSGTLTIGGELTVNLTGGYTPSSGDSFDILDWTGSVSGTFSSIQLPALSSDLAWNATKLYRTGVLSVVDTNHVPGDFDRNHAVGAPDINAMLQALADVKAFESAHTLSDADMLAIGDVNGDGVFTNADIQSLLDLVASLGGGSMAAVPEPSALVLGSIASSIIFGLMLRRGRIGGHWPSLLAGTFQLQSQC